MSFKLIVTIVALLIISHCCVLTKAQRPEGPSSENSSESAESSSRAEDPVPPQVPSEGSGDEEDGGRRLFFGTLFGRRVSCNYTTQAGASCASCNQRLICTRNNRGILTTCRGFLRYCNSGRCSFKQSDQCASGATTTQASATTTQSSATTTQATATTTQATATTTQGGSG